MLDNEEGMFRTGLEMGVPLQDGDVLWVANPMLLAAVSVT